MPISWSLANPKLDEREVLTAMLDREPDTVTDRPGLPVITDEGFAAKEFETDLAMRGAELPRPSFRREKRREGESLLKSVRQLIESVNATLKGRLELEQHDSRTFGGVRLSSTPAVDRDLVGGMPDRGRFRLDLFGLTGLPCQLDWSREG